MVQTVEEEVEGEADILRGLEWAMGVEGTGTVIMVVEEGGIMVVGEAEGK